MAATLATSATSATSAISAMASSTSSTTSDLHRQCLCGSIIPAYGLRGYISIFILVAIHLHRINLGISNIDRKIFVFSASILSSFWVPFSILVLLMLYCKQNNAQNWHSTFFH